MQSVVTGQAPITLEHKVYLRRKTNKIYQVYAIERVLLSIPSHVRIFFADTYGTKNFTRQTNHDRDHLDPHLPFWGAVQDLYGAGPTQGICPEGPIDHAVGVDHTNHHTDHLSEMCEK